MSGKESSSEDENIERFKEAVWSFGTAAGTNATHTTNTMDGGRNGKQSRRAIVSQHDHDGNELQTTPEFRAHVAKKLGAVLDSYISEVSAETPDSHPVLCESREEEEEEEEEEDEGFLLFSTSVPGNWKKDPSPPPRRRPMPSSSDSDSEMEMRLREAAVSLSDLLPPSFLPSSCAEKTVKKEKRKGGEERGRGVDSSVPKKKKKRKVPKELKEGERVLTGSDSPPQAERTDEQPSAEEKLPQKKKKKKKKKMKNEDEVLKED